VLLIFLRGNLAGCPLVLRSRRRRTPGASSDEYFRANERFIRQSIPQPRRRFDQRPVPSLEAYNEARAPFGAPLWLETECCGGKRLWALNERHLDYIERFVRSSNRDRDFPSVAGRRQLADKFPAWLTSRKHREEVIKAIQRLRSTL
jgi:hypothetical protein